MSGLEEFYYAGCGTGVAVQIVSRPSDHLNAKNVPVEIEEPIIRIV